MALVMIVVVFGIAGLFMLSRLLGKKDWEAIAKSELYQVGIATIWIIIIAAAATTTCSVSCSITSDNSPFTTATTYLATVNAGLEQNSQNLINIAEAIRIKSALNIGLTETFVAPWNGCNIVAGNYQTFSAILSPFIGSLILQELALVMINNIAFTLLLPIGMIMRLIPFLRESGSFLIALSFALYIVLPLTYVMADKATAGITTTIVQGSNAYNCVNPGEALGIMQTVGTALPQALFFPALSIIITIAAARSLSKVFNYDFQEIL